MSINLDSHSLIRQPVVAAAAERQPNGDFVIRWAADAPTVTVYTGASPDTIDHMTPLLTTSTGNHEVLISARGLSPRPYFELHFEDGRTVTVAERIVPLQGSVNFRDLGGYATRDGRHVAWGRVYRSGSLADLTDADLDYLLHLGIRTSCDLRLAAEVAEKPDRLPPGLTYWHLPVGGTINPVRRTITLFRKRNRLREVLQEAYTHVMVDQNGDVFGDLFHRLADPANLPLIIHCTAGKDRTGVAVAVLLSALGVDDETIAADYTLSNAYTNVFAGQLADDMRRLFSLGFNESQLRPFLQAEPQTILGMLAHIRGRYGSIRDFLSRMGGVTPETLQRVQDNLLT